MKKQTIITVCGIIVGSFILSYSLVGSLSEFGYGTGEGFGYDVGSLWFTIMLIVGLPYSVYLGYKYEQKKKQPKPDNQ